MQLLRAQLERQRATVRQRLHDGPGADGRILYVLFLLFQMRSVDRVGSAGVARLAVPFSLRRVQPLQRAADERR